MRLNKVYYVPYTIMEETKKFLIEKGKVYEEAFVLWKGTRISDDEFKVTGYIIPKQTASNNLCGYSFDIDSEEIERMNSQLYKNSEMGLIQVHSHPGCSTIHSNRDDDLCILGKKGALSVVLPDFGNTNFTDFSNATVHIQTGVHKWDIIPKSKVKDYIRIVR